MATTIAQRKLTGEQERTVEEAVAKAAAFDTPAPEPISDEEKQFEGHPIGRGLQGALIQSAFQKFGEAFHGGGYTPPGMKPTENPAMTGWRAQGAQVAAALENRWHMAEFANFRKQQVANFQKEAEAVRAESKFRHSQLNRGHWYEPDGSITKLDPNNPQDREKIALLRGELEADVINKIGQLQVTLGMEASEKYPTNPLVGELVQKMYAKATEALLAQYQPKATIAAEESRASIRQTEADTGLKLAQTKQAEAATAATAMEGQEYKSMQEAYQHGGASALDAFMNGTRPGLEMWGAVRDSYRKQADANFEARFIKEHPELMDDEAKMTAALERAKAENESRLEKVAQWQWVNNSLGPEAAEELQRVNPGYGPDPAGPREPAIKGRIPPKEAKVKAKEWGGIALKVYEEYITQADDKDLALEAGIDYILNEWLPERLNGNGQGETYDDYINQKLSASNTQATASYRQQVRDFIEATLKKHAGVGVGGIPPEAKGSAQQRQRLGKPGSGGGVGLVRAIGGLFDDTVYPPKPPKID